MLTRRSFIGIMASSILSLSACSKNEDAGASGGNQASSPVDGGAATASAWMLETETDDFGDEVEGGRKYLNTMFTGTFSNTATTDGEFSGGLNLMWNNGALHYAGKFAILESGENPARYTSSEGMTLKTKSSKGTIHEFRITGNPPTGALVCENADRLVFDLMDETDSLRCILEVGSSRYEFNITSEGFTQAFAENRAEVVTVFERDINNIKAAHTSSTSVDEALENVMPGNNWLMTRDVACLYLAGHAFDFERLSKEEIEALFPATYGLIQITDGTDDLMSWDSMGMTDITIIDYGPTGWTSSKAVDAVDETKRQLISTQTIGGENNIGDGFITDRQYVYEVRRIKDGYYLLRMIDGPSHGTSNEDVYSILFACDDEGYPTN